MQAAPRDRRTPAGDAGRRLAGHGLVALLAAFTYLYGLDSQHIPKNGDEYPYEHITRLTAESGRLLPLRSELPGMRNTKPPLLFWQGIASTAWGRRWTLWDLRYPSVVYTLLTAFLVLLLGHRLSGGPETGLVAASSFLAFFSSFRYGRPFLTNAPEVFWLFLPFFALLYWRAVAPASRAVFPLLAGLAIGVALLYKSFALAVPAGLGLAGWYLHDRKGRLADFLARDSRKVLITLSVSLALFGAWFLLDPDPGAVWREFVLGENLGKFDKPGGYLARLLWGTSSLWSLALGYPLNAGLLLFPVAALFVLAWRHREELTDGERGLWTWVLVLFLVFALPSQRSSRYLLPAMPALAVLLGLGWRRIPRWAFAASLLASGAVVAALAYLSLRLQHAVPGPALYPVAHWALLTGAGVVVLAALWVPALTRPLVLAAVFLCYLSFAAFLRPFDGPLGRYGAAAQRQTQGRDVWVPVDFIAKDEGYRFLLPGAQVRAYREERDTRTVDLLARYPLVVVRRPLRGGAPEAGQVLGQRLDLRGRQTAREIGEILRGNVLEHLFVQEHLIEASAGGAGPR
jgi:4-amino-4-deoxy-L-arabinose transferase-like glycosyltransferase